VAKIVLVAPQKHKIECCTV